jgi:hypothetical protein
MNDELRLKSGLRIGNPTELLRSKFREYPFANWDTWKPSDPHRISFEDAKMAHKLGGRSSDAAYVKWIRQRGAEMSEALKGIPPRAALEDVDLGGRIGVRLRSLFDAALAVKGIKMAGATKVLALFRPRLLPVIDSVVDNYYWYSTSVRDTPRFRKLQQHKTWGEYVLEVLRLIQEDVSSASRRIDAIRSAACDEPWTKASRVRIVESAIWYYYARGDARASGRDPKAGLREV